MATYLYCIRSDGLGQPAGLVGIDGAAVRSTATSTLEAWVSDVAESRVDATVDRVRAHDAVCAAALGVGDTPLPIRFGQTFVDDDALWKGIGARESTLRERLARLSGCVELRVVVAHGRDTDVSQVTSHAGHIESSSTVDADVPVLEGPGTAFLRRLARLGRADLAREVACEDVRHAVRASAAALIVEQRRCEGARGLAFFPVLIRRGEVAAFRNAVARLLLSQEIELSVLGPFAPYSFASDV